MDVPPPRPVATFAEEDGRAIRGSYAVLRVNGEEVFLPQRTVAAIASAFARKLSGRPPFDFVHAIDEEPLRPA